MSLLKQPMVPERFVRYELQNRAGVVLDTDRTTTRLRSVQRALKENRGMYSEIHKVTTRGHTFVG